MVLLLLLVFSHLFHPADGFCAAPDDLAPDSAIADKKPSGFLFIPFPIYTPETKAALILSTLYHFREDGMRHPATLMMFMAYSQLNQFRVGGAAQSYFADGRIHASASAGGAKWPDKFFGIGTDNAKSDEEDYTFKSVDFRVALQYRIRQHFKAGLSAESRKFDISEMEAGGMLDTEGIPGVEGGRAFGAGPIATWDSRDDSFFPRRGVYGQVSAAFFLDRPGDYAFQRYRADLRQYIPLGDNGVIAVQEYVNILRGDIPFNHYSRIGDMLGFSLLRGYYSGLFRERDVAAVQVEYRTAVWKNLGAAVFGGVGVIGPDLPRFRDLAVKPAGGVGLRYRIGGDETINLRLDFAIGKDSSGIYFNILESF